MTRGYNNNNDDDNDDDDDDDDDNNNNNNNNSKLPLIKDTDLIYRFYKSTSQDPDFSHFNSGQNPSTSPFSPAICNK